MLGRVFNFLFPLECIACGAGGSHCCAACASSIPLAPRFWRESELRASAAFSYAHPLVRKLIHDLKFESWTCAQPAIDLLARRWAAKIGGGFCPIEAAIVAIPLHASKRRERGFNQAEMLGETISKALSLPARPDWLERTIRTKPQTASPDRAKNVASAFAARLPAAARGKPILLVDDVWTTGATMRECAKALRAAGSGPVRGFALAYGNPMHPLSKPDRTVK